MRPGMSACPRPLVRRFLVVATLLGGTSACSSSHPSEGSGGGAGGPAPFANLVPCPTVGDYTTAADGTTVMFGGPNLEYAPKCLKIATSASVTFTGEDGETFARHPLSPSKKRGNLDRNPITPTSTAINSKTFAFPEAGFYGYYCIVHGIDLPDAAESYMAGVIWVE
jgi:plastocyanin